MLGQARWHTASNPVSSRGCGAHREADPRTRLAGINGLGEAVGSAPPVTQSVGAAPQEREFLKA